MEELKKAAAILAKLLLLLTGLALLAPSACVLILAAPEVLRSGRNPDDVWTVALIGALTVPFLLGGLWALRKFWKG